jgi:hypothetical protein
MLMGSLAVLAYMVRRLIPLLHDLPAKNFKATLGFYFLSFWFFYSLLPFLIQLSTDLVPLYKEALKDFSQYAAMVLMFYFAMNKAAQPTETPTKKSPDA